MNPKRFFLHFTPPAGAVQEVSVVVYRKELAEVNDLVISGKATM
jgi:hypothetical protein